MPEVAVAPGTVTWVDLASKEIEKSKAFYSKLFNWQPDKIEDPQAGGYTWFLKDGKHAAAVSPIQGESSRQRGRSTSRRRMRTRRPRRSRTPAARSSPSPST